MRVKLDENLPDSVIALLKVVGHDVDTARAEGLQGATDPAVLAGARAARRLLLTLDRGLGDIRAEPSGTHAGILVIRLAHQSPRAMLKTPATGQLRHRHVEPQALGHGLDDRKHRRVGQSPR
ncbi:DUF5615 family PIN-like protein [Nitriliruptor sp.]|uniref:DUF5615 family PIN-like protein n=1 Tax=Nitriliruptor sp. TaxID=2448056 RepID=UPI0034A0A4CE